MGWRPFIDDGKRTATVHENFTLHANRLDMVNCAWLRQ